LPRFQEKKRLKMEAERQKQLEEEAKMKARRWPPAEFEKQKMHRSYRIL
jgi:hypothetical protein